jgi:hypothetical protein
METKTLKDPQIFISKEARALYDNIKKLDEFGNFDNKDFFILAVMFGYSKKKKKQLKKQDRTQSGFTRERYLSPNDISLLKAIAIDDEGDIGVINNIPKVFAIAEEYANGAIDYLKDFIFENPADFDKKFASYLAKLAK